jgi:sugar/nucleoside kinase (ribokinase family)
VRLHAAALRPTREAPTPPPSSLGGARATGRVLRGGRAAARGGCAQWLRRRRSIVRRAPPRSSPGAGDAFCAGFLYGWCQESDVQVGRHVVSCCVM